jgi:hypothetical protein
MTTAAAVAAPASDAATTAHAARARVTTVTATARPAAAVAATHPGTCAGSGSGRYCIIPTQDVWSAEVFNPVIFLRSDGIPVLINGDVSITCWYYGSVGSGYAQDGILDHTVQPDVGHIPDPYVDEGGENPWDAPYDLPEC